jgi:hypothetical protein
MNGFMQHVRIRHPSAGDSDHVFYWVVLCKGVFRQNIYDDDLGVQPLPKLQDALCNVPQNGVCTLRPDHVQDALEVPALDCIGQLTGLIKAHWSYWLSSALFSGFPALFLSDFKLRSGVAEWLASLFGFYFSNLL